MAQAATRADEAVTRTAMNIIPTSTPKSRTNGADM